MNQSFSFSSEIQTGGMPPMRRKNHWFSLISTFLVLVVLSVGCYIGYLIFLAKPTVSSEKQYYEITKGQSLLTISRDLESQGYISSANVFYYTGRILAIGGFVSGEYYLKEPMSTYQLLRMFSSGSYGYTPLKITIPEGYTNKQISVLCTKVISTCSSVDFLEQTRQIEGYLFPATYTFSPNATTEKIIEKMVETYYKRTADIREQFSKTGLSEKEILTLASIIEREAGSEDEKPIIAGILLKRLQNNQPLQVDAPFLYLYGKTSKELSREDLRRDSPYNTYVYKGLPPTPIGNPGITSIEAVVNPQSSPYYFYLHGDNGEIHYAVTYTEHLKNKKLYIK